jgi:cytochrome c oxidase subunit II
VPNTQHAYESVFDVYTPVAIAVFVLVIGALVVAVVRRGRESAPTSANRLEITAALLLACIAAVLVWTTFTAEDPEDHLVAHPAVQITVTAAQWSWRFHYPTGRSVLAIGWDPPPAVIPVDEEIEFSGTSEDVIHGFWVPAINFMRQLFPGYTTHFDLIFERPGVYKGECSVYCGEFHSQMHFTLDVVSRAKYRSWLAHGVLS